MTDTRETIVACVSMFEPLSGSKGKFTSSVALFDQAEPCGEVMRWAREFADRNGRQVIKVELSKNDRAIPSA